MTTEKTIASALCIAALLAGCAPDDGSAELEKARAARAVGDLKSASRALDAAVARCPTNFEAHLERAVVNMDLGETAEAVRSADAACDLDPSSAEARRVAAAALYQSRDHSAAIRLYSSVADDKGLPATLRSQALSSRAVVELAEGSFDAARLSLVRAMRLDRRNAAAWYHLGHLSRDTYHFAAAALEQFETCSRLMPPGDPRTQRIIREVVPALREAVAQGAASRPGVSGRDPGAAAKLISEGEAALKKNQTAKARDKFVAAFKADPLSYPAAWNAARLVAATDRTPGGVDRALAAYRAAIDAKPSSQNTYLAAARYALQKRQPRSAVKILSRAFAHDPESPAVVDLYVSALRSAGEPKTAALYQAYRKEL